MIYFMVISLYDEHASCLRLFTHSCSSEIVRNDGRRFTLQELPFLYETRGEHTQQASGQETGAKKQSGDSEEDSKHKSILLQETVMTLDWNFRHWRTGADQVKWKSFKRGVI